MPLLPLVSVRVLLPVCLLEQIDARVCNRIVPSLWRGRVSGGVQAQAPMPIIRTHAHPRRSGVSIRRRPTRRQRHLRLLEPEL